MAAGRKEYELQMKLTAQMGSTFGSSFQGAMSTVKKLQGTLQNVKKVQGDISAYKKTQEAINATKAKVQEYESKHNALQSELAQTSQKEKDLQAALRETERTTGKDSEEYKKLQKQLQATRDEKSKLKSQIKENERATDAANTKIKEQQQKLSELSKSLQAAGVNTDRLTQENDKLEKAYNRVKKAQEDYARVSSAIEQNKQAISATKGELMKTVGVLGTAGAAFYKGFITPAAEFEEQMSTVKALISASSTDIEGDMSRLKAVAQKMGATTKFTAVEAGKALEYMGMAGWNAAQMESGLPGIMNLAAASGEDLGAVSDIVTDALTAFGMKAEDAGRFADVLAQASSNANTDVGMMGATFQKVAPVAGALGYSVEDMSLAIGLMANASIKADVAGTSLKTAISNMAKPTKQMKSYMDKYGVSLSNSDGSMKSFKEVVENLRSSLGGLSKQEQVAAATAIFGKESYAGMLAIINASEADFDKVSNAVNNATGAAERMANTKLDNLNGDITLAKSAWSGLATTIGDLFLPNCRKAVQKVTEFLNKANDFATKNPELIKQIAKVAAGLAVLKVGSLAGKLGFLQMKGGVLDLAKSFLGFKAKIADTAATALTGGKTFKGIAGIFGGMAGKILPIIAIISALSIAFLKLNGEDTAGFIEPIKSALESAKPVLTSAMEQFKELGKNLMPMLVDAAKQLAPILGQLITGIMPVILGLIQNLVPLICQIVEDVLPGVLDIITTLAPLLTNIITAILPVVVELLNKILPLISQAVKSVLPLVVNLISKLLPLISQIITAVLPVVVQLLESLLPIITEIVSSVLPIAVSIIEALLPLITTIVTTLLPPIIELLNQVLPIATQIIQAILPVVLQLLESILPIITTLVNAVLPVVITVITPIVDIISTLISTILPPLMTILNALMPIIQVVADLFGGVLGTAIQSIMPIIEAITGVFQGLIDFITGIFTGNWSKAWEGVVSIFQNIIDGIINIFKMPINAIIDVINVFIKGLNCLKIPDWVPIVGGKGINIPLIPKLEKGSDYTPDTFIAGDVNGKGGELVTGAKGRKVFTAAETTAIFNNIKTAKQINEINQSGSRIEQAAPVSSVQPSGGETKFEIHYNPTIYVDGEKPSDLEEKLEENNEKLMQMIKEYLRQQKENERRTVYA